MFEDQDLLTQLRSQPTWDVRGVATLLRVSTKTVYRLAKRGALPAIRVGGQLRFSSTALIAWVQR